MNFKLLTTRDFYEKEDVEKLSKIGFAFKYCIEGLWYIIESPCPEIEINTLEDLMRFIDGYGPVFVESGKITIYDHEYDYDCNCD